MVRLTLLSRIHDGLPLAEGLDNEKDRDLDQYKLQAKVQLALYALDGFLQDSLLLSPVQAGPGGRNSPGSRWLSAWEVPEPYTL